MSDINMLKELLTIIEETNNKISNINNDMIKCNTIINIKDRQQQDSMLCINNLTNKVNELQEENNKLKNTITDLQKELNFFKDYNYIS